ncbi:MAG TPA: hypothetical protein VHW24_00015 [Bryobacteraceae bacterium]|jgi:hypothetical protein|nr:hypothetical protein [Bryobacteraceae bacterium]
MDHSNTGGFQGTLEMLVYKTPALDPVWRQTKNARCASAFAPLLKAER